MFDPKIKKIGIFKEDGMFRVYVSHFYWKDFQPYIINENGIRVIHLRIGSYQRDHLDIESSANMEIVVPYKWINERILEYGDYPADYEIILQNGVYFYSNFFSTTFLVPESIIIDFLYKIVPLTLQSEIRTDHPTDLTQLLISHCGEMLIFEKDEKTVNFATVENVYQYFEQLEEDIQYYFCKDVDAVMTADIKRQMTHIKDEYRRLRKVIAEVDEQEDVDDNVEGDESL